MAVNKFKYALLGLSLALCFSTNVPLRAQLPPLPMDSAIQTGTLPSGVTYYMVTDPVRKGYAQVAVVQRNEAPTRSKYSKLDPAFFGRMGIAAGPDGFLSNYHGSSVYRFCQVPFYKAEVLDSTLLYTFARVAESRAPQAVIVSGDIDAVELKKKIDIFSMLVPRMRRQKARAAEAGWVSNPVPTLFATSEGEASVAVTYASARIPYDLMNTAQALVTNLFGAEYQELLRHRLARNLTDAGIPFGEIGFAAQRSQDHGGDEHYTVSVSVRQEQLDEAMRVLACTLGEMDGFGVAVDEFADAKQVLAPGLRRKAAATLSQEEYVDRCIAHFLYGAQLAPYSESLHLFSRKNVADSVETRLFNSYTSAMLEGLENFTLEYTGAPDSLDLDDALFYYNLSYLYGSVVRSGKDYSWHSADTSAFTGGGAKVKIKTEKTEPVTGGQLWTFSNGMRVVYKQVPGSRTFSYALQLNGGLAQIPGLVEGEGGYIGELLSLYDVAGMSCTAFRDMLAANGISMDTHVDVNSMDISGSAPSDRLSLLLKTLQALANHRRPNAAAFQFYCEQEQLRSSGLEATLFRHLNPGYACSPYKWAQSLTEETRKKAGKYYEDRFTRMNDGVLILSGDLSEEGVKKLLQRHLGGFRTLRGSVVRRPVDMQTLSGETTVSLSHGPQGFYLLMDTGYALTTANFYTAHVAQDALKTSLARHLAPYGFVPQVQLLYCAQPQERFQFLIFCPGAPLEALPAVRAAVKDVEFDDEDLKAWKKKLEADTKRVLATPDGFVATLLARYSANKDITSNFAEAIGGISASQVQDFLKALAAGGCIEYLVHE